MIAKPLLAMASLLLVAALTPVTIAHDDNASRTGDVDAGVAGTYYGSFSGFVSLTTSVFGSSGLAPESAFDPSRMSCGCHDDNRQPPPDPPQETDPLAILTELLTLDWYVVQGRMICDLEVGGDGTSAQEPDESRIDGASTGVGLLADGTFDDGGIGGACHTNHYDHDDYNTAGCTDDGARASNVALLAAPWIGAGCDWKTRELSTPDLDILMTCLATGVLDGLNDQPGDAIGCAQRFIGCFTNPPTCVTNGTDSCGSDYVLDAINFGAGNTRIAYPYSTPDGNSFTDDGNNCLQRDATMQVYAFTGVAVTDAPFLTMNPAVQGDIWQVP